MIWGGELPGVMSCRAEAASRNTGRMKRGGFSSGVRSDMKPYMDFQIEATLGLVGHVEWSLYMKECVPFRLAGPGIAWALGRLLGKLLGRYVLLAAGCYRLLEKHQ